MAAKPSDEKRAYWQAVLEDYAGSGLSVAEFCRRNSLVANSFHYWRRKLKGEDGANRNGSLIPVRLKPSAASDSTDLLPQRTASLTIRIPGGLSIDIYSADDQSSNQLGGQA